MPMFSDGRLSADDDGGETKERLSQQRTCTRPRRRRVGRTMTKQSRSYRGSIRLLLLFRLLNEASACRIVARNLLGV